MPSHSTIPKREEIGEDRPLRPHERADFIPPWLDLPGLCRHAAITVEMVPVLVARHVLPSPKILDGTPMWKWATVQRLLAGRVYFLDAGDQIKIGFSESLKGRIKNLRKSSPVALKLICVIKGGKLREATLHETFAHLRLHGEWFRTTTELRAFIAALKARPFESVGP